MYHLAPSILLSSCSVIYHHSSSTCSWGALISSIFKDPHTWVFLWGTLVWLFAYYFFCFFKVSIIAAVRSFFISCWNITPFFILLHSVAITVRQPFSVLVVAWSSPSREDSTWHSFMIYHWVICVSCNFNHSLFLLLAYYHAMKIKKKNGTYREGSHGGEQNWTLIYLT